MRVMLQIITGLILLAYPLAVYFGLNYLPAGTTALLLCGLLVVRLVLQKQALRSMLLPMIVGIGLTLGSFVAKRHDWLLFYPIVINVTMLFLFASSLVNGPSMIEKFARLKHAELPAEAIPYLRKVTLIWCALFIINGSMAAYTAIFTSLATWTLYNGLIAYLLMGCLFAGEWLYRKLWIKQ
ncbi:hypothetical protein [Shewanella marina]|uniref:COG4648 family protein n=1 Tax=Shewanella marina TaxID=487319 RepID=UPI000472B5A0|nr:hypothetical protein [Shewanella marina]